MSTFLDVFGRFWTGHEYVFLLKTNENFVNATELVWAYLTRAITMPRRI